MTVNMPLEPRERALLDAYRETLSLSPEREAELMRGLEGLDLPPLSDPPLGDGGGSAMASGVTVAPVVQLVWAGVAAACLAAAVGLGGSRAPSIELEPAQTTAAGVEADPESESESELDPILAPPPTRSTPEPRKPVSATIASAETGGTPLSQGSKPAVSGGVPLARKSTSAGRGATSSSVPPVAAPNEDPGADASSDLEAELALMRSVREALAQGAHAKVLTLVDEHAERFPAGVFANEREVSRAEALCARGELDEGLAVAEAFLRRHPKSHLVGRVERACPVKGL